MQNQIIDNTYIVILAGGKGERLWPLSRNQRPKQILPFINQKSLLEHTIERIKDLVPKKNLFIITNKEQYQIIKNMVGNQLENIIAEPVARNTAPSIILASLHIQAQNPNARIIFLPADHYIKDNAIFRNYLTTLIYNSDDTIKLIGIKPQYPATGYGYIAFDATGNEPFKVIKFTEKPSRKKAEEYCESKKYLWNIGIFAGFVKTFLDECKIINKNLFETATAYFVGRGNYEDCPNISFDYAILEKSNRCVVIPASFEWSDVGNLETFLSYKKEYNQTNNIISINATNNVINVPEKLVALIGVDDLCIVQTDDVLLVAKRTNIEEVKQAVQQIKLRNQEQYL